MKLTTATASIKCDTIARKTNRLIYTIAPVFRWGVAATTQLEGASQARILLPDAVYFPKKNIASNNFTAWVNLEDSAIPFLSSSIYITNGISSDHSLITLTGETTASYITVVNLILVDAQTGKDIAVLKGKFI